uniref:Uncharacterized protein n=1 Tax=Anguilla anguilla TaxID=7936 RepID=A0A0E9VHM8_ANGAN
MQEGQKALLFPFLSLCLGSAGSCGTVLSCSFAL